MELEQDFELAIPIAQAFTAFQDIELLVDCLPGASITGADDKAENRDGPTGAVPLRFEVRLGPIAAAFTGTGQLQTEQSSYTGQFDGNAVDRKTNSRVKGVANFTLHELSADDTRVAVKVDYSLAGSLAQFNRAGIVNKLADVMTAKFAENLRQRISTGSAHSDQFESVPSTEHQ